MSSGKRMGPTEQRGRVLPRLLGLAAGITACLLAWGYLVYIAIDFGAEARRDGNGAAWGLLAVAGIGAVACLFLAFLLLTRLLQAIGLFPEPTPRRSPGAPKGGKRAKR
ncbi:hypothetical protein KUV85_10315 [Nocardioides panacisoli]|uniref:hypothetical protein n=1 Tax=Nocardioides panacisoli TaxID=627624 RepID=UPI001C631302|nr:hypothetical protein [Nocardioides panacisoli]QYJ02732.1 hypothetical protein KUV85_10315 [Nocardioides panacisoli]